MKLEHCGLTASQIELKEEQKRRRRLIPAVSTAAIGLIVSVGFVVTRGIAQSPEGVASPVRSTPRTAQTDRPPVATLVAVQPIAATPSPPALVESPALVKPQTAEASLPSEVGQPSNASVDHATTFDAAIQDTDPRGYAVQVAAMPGLEQARALLDRLSSGGHHAYVTRTVVGDKALYRVRVGPIESRVQADETVRQLVAEGHSGPWVSAN